MKTGEQVSVTLTEGECVGTFDLSVEDFQPIEPSAYAWSAGWNCAVEIGGASVWFFVDEAGVVYDDENDAVGTCPQQEREYAVLCAHHDNFMRDYMRNMREGV